MIINKKKLSTALITAVTLASSVVSADHSVTINDTTYTCDNTCNIVFYSNGSVGISDCCGGQVHMSFTI